MGFQQSDNEKGSGNDSGKENGTWNDNVPQMPKAKVKSNTRPVPNVDKGHTPGEF